MPIPLLIFPCNGNAIEALDCLGERFRLIGFVDDSADKVGTERFGKPVLSRSAFEAYPEAKVLAVPGSPASYRNREVVVAGLGVSDDRFATVIHPAARVSPLASVGFNVLIMAGVVITSNVEIGNHICILPNTVIHHDASIGDWSLIGSNVTIAGSVAVGANSYIGSGTSVINGIRIGEGALLGIGSNVLREVAPHTTVAGNPARQLRG
ncbi:MAG TPA: NeuD/PglB/VioB family sugar acetyltransferase [Povalibacter sp.]